MPYTYDCDGYCNEDEQHHHGRPALTGEFNEEWFKTSEDAGYIADDYNPGDLVTLCGPCTRQLLLEAGPDV